MKNVTRGIIILMIFAPVSAFAGTVCSANDADKEQACWLAEKAANAFAMGHNTCYRPCSMDACKQARSGWTCVAVAANHPGSCKKSGYIPAGTLRPAPRQPQPQPQPQGKIEARLIENGNKATLILKNSADTKRTIWVKVTVLDAGYNQPRSVKLEGNISLEGQQTYTHELHQWRAAQWRLETKN